MAEKDVTTAEHADRVDRADHTDHVDRLTDDGHIDEKGRENVAAVFGFVADESTLPKGYYYSPFFLGTMTATGVGLIVAVGGFGLAAPNLTLINNDIGPSANIFWVSLVYTLTLAIGLLLVGRLSDLFGRRVFSPSPGFISRLPDVNIS